MGDRGACPVKEPRCPFFLFLFFLFLDLLPAICHLSIVRLCTSEYWLPHQDQHCLLTTGACDAC